jgi:hypothetical protein
MKKLAGLFSNPTMATNNIEDYRLEMSGCLQIIKAYYAEKNCHLVFTIYFMLPCHEIMEEQGDKCKVVFAKFVTFIIFIGSPVPLSHSISQLILQ